MKLDSILAVAVGSESVGIVFCKHGEVIDTGISRKAYTHAHDAAKLLQEWTTLHTPDIIVTERFAKNTKRGQRTIDTSKLLGLIASYHNAYDISVVADREGRTRFEQATLLAELYPDIAHRLPKQNSIWESEDRAMVLFAALGLIHQVRQKPVITIAAHMDKAPNQAHGED